ncbi:MAG: asparaginase [Kiloniellaceae bacterium]
MDEAIMRQEHGRRRPGAVRANPVLAEATRGAMIESRHRAAVAVIDPVGKVVLSAGDIERPVYARSAIKPLQALPLLESGAADAFSVTDPEIALACASHAGEPRHVAAVATWLERVGCAVEDLECAPHLPFDEAAMRALLRAGAEPSALHNNCSGKHAGFLTLARRLGVPTKGYIRFEHPVQQRILGVLEGMTGLDLGAAPRGIDGCGIPVVAIPLGNLALAMARLADPHDQPEARRAACARVRAAMAAEPFMVAGTGRFCTRVIEATGGRALIKTGAEGVYCGALPERGLGIALKVDDGAGRAAEVVMGRVLGRLGVIGDDRAALLAHPVRNRAGIEVGRVRCPEDCPF